MSSLSHDILAFLLPFSKLFSKPTWKKALTLLCGTLLCTRKRTVCAALRAMGLSQESSFSKYHYLLNRGEWSSLLAGKILFFMLLRLVKKDNPLVLMIDETLERRKGAKIKAKGYYRDAVRSSKSQVVKSTGLEWLVMSLSIRFPFARRAFALPFLSVLEPSKKANEAKHKRHKTTVTWASQMMLQVKRWIGDKKKIILVGDGGFAAGKLALASIKQRVALVSRLKINARLFDFPPEKIPGKRGRPPKKGEKLFNFKEMLSLETLSWEEKEIVGYGGVKRKVRFISNTAMWGASGVGPLPIRWVLIADPLGKMDPLPLMSTDPLLKPEKIIELYIDRWGLEVTFEETREHLGVETQRQWSEKAIARCTPVLMALYSLVCLMGNRLNQDNQLKAEQTAWYKKKHATFSDILRLVRMTIWRDSLILHKGKTSPYAENITPEIEQWASGIVERILQAA